MLLGSVVRNLDSKGSKCFVNSSKTGKGLYEKFGWRSLDEAGFEIDLGQFGMAPFVSWDIVRHVGGVVRKVEVVELE